MMLKKVSLFLVCCLLASCSSRQYTSVQSETFAVRNVDKSTIQDIMFHTCQALGWSIQEQKGDKLVATIERNKMTFSVNITCKEDGLCTIEPIGTQPKRKKYNRLFDRLIKNLRKRILNNIIAKKSPR